MRSLEIDPDGRIVASSFLQAASNGSVDGIRKGLESRDRRRLMVATDQQQRSAAHLAAREGHAEVLQLLHDHGCELEALDRFGRSPLHLACEHGKANAAKFLLDCGVKPNLEDRNGRNALHLAACCEDPSLSDMLASQFPQLVFCADVHGRTPLFYAALNAHPQSQGEVTKMLLQQCADINHRDFYGRVALHYAAEEGQLNALRLLLKNKIDINAEDKGGQTALQIASNEAVRRELTKALGVEAAGQPHPSAASSHHAAKPRPASGKKSGEKTKGDAEGAVGPTAGSVPSLPPLRRHPSPIPAPDVLGQPFQQLQMRFVQLMERVQQGGLEQMLHVTRPHLFNGSWMRDVSTHQQLLGQALKYVPGPEVCLRIFNLLHPPKDFPSVQGDECAIMSYYDGGPKAAWQGIDDIHLLGPEDEGLAHGRRVELLKAIREQRQQMDLKDEQLEEQKRKLEHFQEELARCLNPDEAKILRSRLAQANAQVTRQAEELEDNKAQVRVLEGQVSVLGSHLKQEAEKNSQLIAEQCALRRKLEAEHALRGEQKSWQECFEQEQQKAATLQLRLEAQVTEAAQKQLAAETAKQQLQAQVLELQELAKIGREALEFKQKAENAAVDLQASQLKRSQLLGELDAMKKQSQNLQSALDEANRKGEKLSIAEHRAEAAEEQVQKLNEKLQAAQKEAEKAALLETRLADKEKEMKSQDQNWQKMLSHYHLVAQLLIPSQPTSGQPEPTEGPAAGGASDGGAVNKASDSAAVDKASDSAAVDKASDIAAVDKASDSAANLGAAVSQDQAAATSGMATLKAGKSLGESFGGLGGLGSLAGPEPHATDGAGTAGVGAAGPEGAAEGLKLRPLHLGPLGSLQQQPLGPLQLGTTQQVLGAALQTIRGSSGSLGTLVQDEVAAQATLKKTGSGLGATGPTSTEAGAGAGPSEAAPASKPTTAEEVPPSAPPEAPKAATTEPKAPVTEEVAKSEPTPAASKDGSGALPKVPAGGKAAPASKPTTAEEVPPSALPEAPKAATTEPKAPVTEEVAKSEPTPAASKDGSGALPKAPAGGKAAPASKPTTAEEVPPSAPPEAPKAATTEPKATVTEEVAKSEPTPAASKDGSAVLPKALPVRKASMKAAPASKPTTAEEAVDLSMQSAPPAPKDTAFAAAGGPLAVEAVPKAEPKAEPKGGPPLAPTAAAAAPAAPAAPPPPPAPPTPPRAPEAPSADEGLDVTSRPMQLQESQDIENFDMPPESTAPPEE